MKRIVLVICGVFLLAACIGVGFWLARCASQALKKPPAAMQPQDEPGAKTETEPQGAKTRIVRSMLDVVDDVRGESKEVKDELKESLLEADEELSRVLGGNSRRLIEQANKKPPVPIIGATGKPPHKPAAQTELP